MPTLKIQDSTMDRLKKHGLYKDTWDTIINRILDHYEGRPKRGDGTMDGIMKMRRDKNDRTILEALAQLKADEKPVDLYTLAEHLKLNYNTLYYRLYGDPRKGIGGLVNRTSLLAFVPILSTTRTGIMLTRPATDEDFAKENEKDDEIWKALGRKNVFRLSRAEIEDIAENFRRETFSMDRMDESYAAEWILYQKLCKNDLGEQYPFRIMDEQELKRRRTSRDQIILMALRRLQADHKPVPLTALAQSVDMSDHLLKAWVLGDERHEALTARNQNVIVEAEGIRLIK